MFVGHMQHKHRDKMVIRATQTQQNRSMFSLKSSKGTSHLFHYNVKFFRQEINVEWLHLHSSHWNEYSQIPKLLNAFLNATKDLLKCIILLLIKFYIIIVILMLNVCSYVDTLQVIICDMVTKWLNYFVAKFLDQSMKCDGVCVV